jgi:hypothetical protein
MFSSLYYDPNANQYGMAATTPVIYTTDDAGNLTLITAAQFDAIQGTPTAEQLIAAMTSAQMAFMNAANQVITQGLPPFNFTLNQFLSDKYPLHIAAWREPAF